ncbi:hypothetical protein C8R45DRAFT_1105880 [Mycena sanguinolenta]|nr:hypothetical protein C8R45DRAFT_1105880 [Mycena sanguinolenta]
MADTSATVPSAEALATEAVLVRLSTEDTNGGRKRKAKEGEAEDDDVTQSLRDYGRAFLRLGDPFTDLDDIVQHGIFIETTEEIDYPIMGTAERQKFDRRTQSWEILWRMIGQKFREEMIALEKKRKLRRRTCSKAIPLDPPIQPSAKLTRGFNHPVTARLLCPAKYPPNEETYTKIANGNIVITGKTFPRLFYPDDWIYTKNADDTDNLMDGLFEGHLIPRVGKCILQGPSSALKPPGAHRGERGNAAKIGARTVTPRLMGYFAFQTVFAISGIDTWRQVEGNFDYEEFYWTVVSLFEDGDNAHILENFNHQIFGSVAGKATTSTPTQNSEEEEDDLAAYQALRAAKKARLAAADASQAALPSSSE